MSESNPLQPNSPFPDPINPNSIPPHPGPNEFVRTKRSTRNSGSDNKQSMKNTGTSSKVSLGVKKSNKKGTGRIKNLAKDMEGMEFEGDEMEEIEAKDDEVELNGGINETAVNPSSQGVIGSVDGSNLEATNHGKSHVNSVMVNDSGNCDSSTNNYAELPVSGSNAVNASDKGASTVVGVMPVPFIENPGGNNDVELGTKGKDTVMTEKFVQNNVSFASSFKGLTGYGNNKLTKVPVRRNEQAYGRASFARVLIEVDADKELVDNVEVCYASLGRSMQLKVEYAWKPPQCLLCKVLGHDQKTCNKREVSVEERVEMTKVANDSHMKQNNSNGGDREWQEVNRFVNNGSSTSKTDGQQNFGYYGNRGGSNNRGRGGFMGRGGMMSRGGMSQRGNKYNNVVKNMNLENNGKKVDEGIIIDSNSKNDKKGKGVSGSKVEVKNKVNKQSDLNTKNKFDVLAKDGMNEVEIGSEEWIQMRKKIDLACDLGMIVADSEKSRWSKDLKKYYEEKCNNKAKGRMMEGLKWRIDKLQKDISYGHTNIAMQAKLKADEMCQEIMKETGSMLILVSGCATLSSLLLLMMQYGNSVASCCEEVDVDFAGC
ncbi:zinc knuckle CX2CX4HX4C [Artemisia annua]|uniref:Zinc knuckle CX2CX4HX4C n=1 Tax=Artemisia annua TaxID=35608 RepID=A0A2U1QPF7_ARTAN|nr:zinc knuckle CX2CX4HX4C [Artemisia annua]